MEKTAKKKHPVLSKPYLGAVLLIIWGFVFVDYVSVFVPLIITDGQDGPLVTIFCIAFAFVALIIHRLWFHSEYSGSFLKGTSFVQPILIACAVFIVADLIFWVIDIIRLGFTLINVSMFLEACMAGIAEETIFRVLPVSVMMRSLKDRDSYLPALIFPAICFGLLHITNATDAPLDTTILQVASACFTGIMLAAIYLRTGSILLPMIIHAFHDAICFMISTQSTGIATTNVGVYDIVEEVIMASIQIAIVIWLLRGHKDEIMAIWQRVWK